MYFKPSLIPWWAVSALPCQEESWGFKKAAAPFRKLAVPLALAESNSADLSEKQKLLNKVITVHLKREVEAKQENI